MPIAIFDLDGTITRRDTLFPLVLRHLARRPWHLLRLLRVVAGRAALSFRPRPRRAQAIPAARDPARHAARRDRRSSHGICARQDRAGLLS